MKKFNICTTDSVRIDGMRLPKGAMYGTDSKGMWICLDYHMRNIFDLPKRELVKLAKKVGIKVAEMEEYTAVTRRLLINALKREKSLYKRPRYMNMRDENGSFERVLVRSAEVRPLLYLLRPIKRDMTTNTGYENRTKWIKSIEFGEVVDKILELVERYPERTEIVRGENHCFKSIPVIVNGAIGITNVPTVSNRQAQKVAGNPDGRGIKEFMPHTVMHGLTKPQMTEYSFATGNYVDLEKLAAEQRAAAPKKGPQKKPAILINIYPEISMRR